MEQYLLNGESVPLAQPISIAKLTEQLGLAGQRYAVEINKSIIPRSMHTSTLINANDNVEIVQAIGGG